MPGGPIVVRDLYPEQIRFLDENGVLAFIPRTRLGVGETLMIWWEEEARWVWALVESVVEKPGLRELESHLERTPYRGVAEWLRLEERRLGGVLPRRIVIVRRLEGRPA